MFSVFRVIAALAMITLSTLASASMTPLRVCADSNNLPFSNTREEGFENAIARMVAHDLRRDIQFIWLPQQAPAAIKAMNVQNCDLVMGLTSPTQLMVPSISFYRSTYVFVTRRDRHIGISSLADNRLADYRIGAHIIGGADATVPPAEELARRGLVRNIVGYSLYGDPLEANPPADLITAVQRGDVDMAVAWGPMAGYFAKQSAVPLDITAICPDAGASEPVAFDISMGVRRGDDLLLEQINRVIASRQKTIRAILLQYSVPLLDTPRAQVGCL